MENAVGLLKIPLGLFASLVWQVSLENVEQINSLLLQFGKLRHWNTRLASGNVPVHALNEHLHNLIAGISHVRQAVQTGSRPGPVDCCVVEFSLVYTSICFNKHDISMYILEYTITSGAMRSRTRKGRVSISIFMRSPVILAFSLPSM